MKRKSSFVLWTVGASAVLGSRAAQGVRLSLQVVWGRREVSGGFLGKGLRFPVEIDCQGGVATSEADESIRQSIQVVLGTAPGERVMRPHFGCQIHDLLYASNNIHTASLAAHFATEALTKWEPRITDVEVEADPSREEPNRLDLHVRYCVRATHSSRSLIYPFYLRRSER